LRWTGLATNSVAFTEVLDAVERVARVAGHEALRYTPPMRRLHHTNPDCPDGAQIQRHHRQAGTGTKPLCRQCSQLG
jgi:hypothetical protein